RPGRADRAPLGGTRLRRGARALPGRTPGAGPSAPRRRRDAALLRIRGTVPALRLTEPARRAGAVALRLGRAAGRACPRAGGRQPGGVPPRVRAGGRTGSGGARGPAARVRVRQGRLRSDVRGAQPAVVAPHPTVQFLRTCPIARTVMTPLPTG